MVGWLDKKHSEIHKEIAGNRIHSDLRKSQTPREFFKTIDDVITDSGIDINEIKRLQNLNKIDNQGSHYKKLYDLVLPVYIKLREIGYERTDFIG